MKSDRLYAALLSFAMLVSMVGCGNRNTGGNATQENGSKDSKTNMLIKSIDNFIDSEHRTIEFDWATDSCNVNFNNNRAYRFTWENDSVLKVSQEDATLLEFSFDENGYITKTSFSNDKVIGTIVYSDNYSKFVWDLGTEGMINGTRKDNSIVFDLGEKTPKSWTYTFDDVSIVKIHAETSDIDGVYQYEKNDKGKWSSMLYTEGDKTVEYSITLTDLPQVNQWQNIPLGFVCATMGGALYYAEGAGSSAINICMSAITLSYIK